MVAEGGAYGHSMAAKALHLSTESMSDNVVLSVSSHIIM
jgi:hypothetical protein